MVRPVAVMLALVAALAATAAARADLRICNRTDKVVNVALGRSLGEGFRTEGWWSIAADSCQPVVRGAIDSRFFYLYVTGIEGRSLIAGQVEMCVRRRGFEIDGIEDCWRRGYEAALFTEVDTKDFDSWTVFLEEDGRLGGEAGE